MIGVAMNVQITSRKFRLKESLREFINKELKSIEKFNDDVLEANVILSFTHPKDSIKTAEIITKVPGKTITVSESSEDFQKSTSLAIEKTKRQLKILKSKRISRVKND